MLLSLDFTSSITLTWHTLCTMPVLRVRVHPSGLSMAMQCRAFALRTHGLKGQKLSWPKIAEQVVNLKGDPPFWKVCQGAFNKMNTSTGVAEYAFESCRRKPILTKALRNWVIGRLLVMRSRSECTCYDLQHELLVKNAVALFDAATSCKSVPASTDLGQDIISVTNGNHHNVTRPRYGAHRCQDIVF